MKINSVKLYKYDLPFLKPLKLRMNRIHSRSGFLLFINDKNNKTGIGEIAPLPYFHQETLKDVLGQIKFFASAINNGKEIRELITHSSFPVYPSVRFGFEMAVTDLHWQYDKTYQLLQGKTVPLNALILPNSKDLQENVRSLIGSGYKSIKMKIGNDDFNSDVEKVKQARGLLPSNVSLRLDCNRQWSIADAVAFGKAVGSNSIEYIEEPFSHDIVYNIDNICANYKRFSDETGLPIALDETLLEYPALTTSLSSGIAAYILKPSIYGDLKKIYDIVEISRQNNILSVISSAFESTLTLAFLAFMIAKLGINEKLSGLDTWKFFSHHLTEGDFPVRQGRVVLKDLDLSLQKIDFERLERVI